MIKQLFVRFWQNEDSYSSKQIGKLEYEVKKHELLTNILKLKNRLEL